MKNFGKMKKLLCLIICTTFFAVIFSGCGRSKDSGSIATHYGKDANIKIALLGSKQQLEKQKAFTIGMDLAIEELAKKGFKISYELCDDNGEKDTGIGLAKDISQNDEYTMAFSFQEDVSTIDSVAAIFNSAKKPLLIVNRIDEDTMNRGYEYVLSGTMSSKSQGEALAKYCNSKKVKRVASAHSYSEYEIPLVREFNDAVNDVTTLMESVAGPRDDNEADRIVDRWVTLGIEAALVSFDDQELACKFIKKLKSKIPNIMILMNYAISENLDLIQENIDTLAGAILVSPRKIDKTDRLTEFYSNYRALIQQEQNVTIDGLSANAYDFVYLIAEKVQNSTDVNNFMENIKGSTSSVNLTGIKFNSDGYIDGDPNYWVIKNDVGFIYRDTTTVN